MRGLDCNSSLETLDGNEMDVTYKLFSPMFVLRSNGTEIAAGTRPVADSRAVWGMETVDSVFTELLPPRKDGNTVALSRNEV